MNDIKVGDTVHVVDRRELGKVVKISDESQRGRDGRQYHMALVQWPSVENWEPPELLMRVES